MTPCYYCETDDDACKTCIHSDTYEDPSIEIQTLRSALKMALDALEFECANRCNAEYNPCNARDTVNRINEVIKSN